MRDAELRRPLAIVLARLGLVAEARTILEELEREHGLAAPERPGVLCLRGDLSLEEALAAAFEEARAAKTRARRRADF